MDSTTVLLVIILVVVSLFLFFNSSCQSAKIQTEKFDMDIPTDKYLYHLKRKLRRCMNKIYVEQPELNANEMWDYCIEEVLDPLNQ